MADNGFQKCPAGRGGSAANRFPDVKGSAQVDPKKGPVEPVKGSGKPRTPRPSK